MAGFQDLTNLLSDDPAHRIVVVREDGTPVGVLLPVAAYQGLLKNQDHRDDRESMDDDVERRAVVENALANAQAVHDEWDQLMEKVGEKEEEKTEETYLFEPVE